MNTKQVIVIRKDLHMRRGKEIAQACHASMAFLTRQLQFQPVRDGYSTKDVTGRCGVYEVTIGDTVKHWIDANFAKVCLQVNSEAELLEIEAKAKAAGLEVHLVTDSGLTEFAGVPTNTCLAIGPDEVGKIDQITGHLKLY